MLDWYGAGGHVPTGVRTGLLAMQLVHVADFGVTPSCLNQQLHSTERRIHPVGSVQCAGENESTKNRDMSFSGFSHVEFNLSLDPHASSIMYLERASYPNGTLVIRGAHWQIQLERQFRRYVLEAHEVLVQERNEKRNSKLGHVITSG